LAGFETSSTTLSFCLYELAVNPDIQTKLREEVDVTLEKLGGQITYDGVQSMKYLSQVIDGKNISLYCNMSITGLQNRKGLYLMK
jgi:cytochrome P450 family 6